MRAGDRAGVVAFASDAVIDQPVAARAPSAVTSLVSGGGTNIESALRLARTALREDGVRRVVLFSDGRDTSGDPIREAVIAAGEGIQVDVAPLADAPRPLLRAWKLDAPAEVRVGEPFQLVVQTAGTAGRSGAVIISRNGERIGRAAVTIDASGVATTVFQDTLPGAGAATYTASAGGDEAPADVGTVVTASGVPAVLYVSAGAGQIDRVIASASIRVTRLPPAALPASESALAQYDALVLDHLSADSLSDRQGSAVTGFVEDHGGGLLVLAGGDTLARAALPEGWLARALPIELRSRGGARSTDAALVLVFDKSGSMADAVGGVSKIDLARTAVMSVLQVLPPSARMGVIAFDAAPAAVAPLAAGHDADAVRAALRRVEPAGATAISPAIEAARAWLGGVEAATRHIVLISDGRSSASDAARALSSVRGGNIEVSVVAIGGDVDRQFLQTLATVTGGRVYFPDDSSRLPEIVAREAASVLGGWKVRERFTVRAGSHPVLAGIDRSALPGLDRYLLSVPRATSQLILTSHRGDPILAAWRFGLGRVAVFTADMSEDFRRWAGFSVLWRQTTRWIGRGRDRDGLSAAVEWRGDDARLVVEPPVVEGRYETSLQGQAMFRRPGGETGAAPLGQTAPGRYEAVFDTPQMGTYLAAIDLGDESGVSRYRAIRGFYRASPASAPDSVARARLARIAEAGGGRVLGAGDSPFAGARPPAYRDLSTILATAALFLFVLDIALRRGLTIPVG
jgi:Mg-chelatase subunit ChlD